MSAQPINVVSDLLKWIYSTIKHPHRQLNVNLALFHMQLNHSPSANGKLTSYLPSRHTTLFQRLSVNVVLSMPKCCEPMGLPTHRGTNHWSTCPMITDPPTKILVKRIEPVTVIVIIITVTTIIIVVINKVIDQK